MRALTEYEITKILNRAEIKYVKEAKDSTHDSKKFNLNAVYVTREIRKKINNYLDKKYEN